ncbi:MAG: hypothetical protein U0574_11040 [Phycisphaerales bacterium]
MSDLLERMAGDRDLPAAARATDGEEILRGSLQDAWISRHPANTFRWRGEGRSDAYFGQRFVSLPKFRHNLRRTAALPPAAILHRRLLSALRAAKVSHKGWTDESDPVTGQAMRRRASEGTWQNVKCREPVSSSRSLNRS